MSYHSKSVSRGVPYESSPFSSASNLDSKSSSRSSTLVTLPFDRGQRLEGRRGRSRSRSLQEEQVYPEYRGRCPGDVLDNTHLVKERWNRSLGGGNDDAGDAGSHRKASLAPSTYSARDMLSESGRMKSHTDTCYFWDGERRVDMVLAYEDPENEDDFRKQEKRESFQQKLHEQGLDLELEPSQRSMDKKTNFLKISAPWEILVRYAEMLNLKMPIKDEGYDDDCTGVCGFWERLQKPMEYDTNLIPPEPNFFTAGFLMEREDKFIVKDRETFFTGAQRSQMVWQILMRTPCDPDNPEKLGIMRLLSGGVYTAAYPLHDGKYDSEGPGGQISDRRILFLEWANGWKWYKKQPLWLIKRYFGDKIGLYFAWLGFYTQMLIAPAILGLIVFLYGAITVQSDSNFPSQEICHSEEVGNITMCPQCDNYCPTWQLKESCFLSKVSYMFDNTGTVIFAVLMSLWATMFLEFWKRRQAVIAWEWDLTNFEEEEQTRPEYESKVRTHRINPVTKKPEPFLPPWNKTARVALTTSFLLFMLSAFLATVFGVMLYKLIIFGIFSSVKYQLVSSVSSLAASASASCIMLVVCMFMKLIYQHIALWLTNMERPRTQTDFEDSYTFKMFMFQCINFYSSLVYIAFFKGKFFSHPGDKSSRKNNLGRFKNDVCDPAGCLYELCIQLAIIMVGKQAFNNFIELFMPKMITWWKRYIYRSSAVDVDCSSSEEAMTKKRIYTRWEMDYNLRNIARLSLLDEYLEMVIQYGFVTLFVAAFPLAPVFALLNNIIEIRLDAYKFITTGKRPLAQRAQDIGAWSGILQAITYISVATNAITIALGSDFVPHFVYISGYSKDFTLKGYIQWSLSAFNTSDWGPRDSVDYPGPNYDNSTVPDTCYFKGNRGPGPVYAHDMIWYQVIGAKLAFVLAFEHVVFGITGLIAVVIPDVPRDVKLQIQREGLLAREVLFEEGTKSKRAGTGAGQGGQGATPEMAQKDRRPSSNAAVVLYDSEEEVDLRQRAHASGSPRSNWTEETTMSANRAGPFTIPRSSF